MSLNSVPLGLLEFLQNKIDGRNPVELGERLVPTLAIDRFYELGFAWQMQTFTPVDPAGAVGPLILRTFVNEQLLLIRGMNVRANFVAAGALPRGRAAVFRLIGGAAPEPVLLGDQSTLPATGAAFSPVSRLLAPGDTFILRAGVQYALGVQVESAGAAAGQETWSGSFEFANLSNQ